MEKTDDEGLARERQRGVLLPAKLPEASGETRDAWAGSDGESREAGYFHNGRGTLLGH